VNWHGSTLVTRGNSGNDFQAAKGILRVSPHSERTVSTDKTIQNENKPMKKISLLLVDDHTVVRQGLRALLNPE
jgi:hypothetical protein